MKVSKYDMSKLPMLPEGYRWALRGFPLAAFSFEPELRYSLRIERPRYHGLIRGAVAQQWIFDVDEIPDAASKLAYNLEDILKRQEHRKYSRNVLNSSVNSTYTPVSKSS